MKQAGPAQPSSPHRASCALAGRGLPPEEVALRTGLHVPLVDELQSALVEDAEPLVPRDVFKVLVLAVVGKVEREHSRMAVVLGAGDGGRDCAAFLGPPPDRVVIAGHKGLAGTVLVLVGGG